jgi:hypothetical protein
MSSFTWRSRTALIVPIVLLIVTLFEDVVTYKVRQHVRDLHTRALIILVLNAFAFGIAATWVGPWLKDLFSSVRKSSRKTAGNIGIWVFYAAAYGALYYAFFIVERFGPGGLLPASLR